MERVNSLEGIRGMAATMVLFSHLGVIFYPAYYWGGMEQHSKFFEYCFGQTSLGFFLSGNSGVMIFLILTGFGSYMVCDKGRESYVKYATLRFFKLSVLMFLSTIIIWLLFKFCLVYYYDIIDKTNTIWIRGYAPFNDNLLSLVFGNWFSISSNYNGTLWTMPCIFLSSVICILVYTLWGNLRKNYLILIGIIGIFMIMDLRYYVASILGYILAYLYKRKSGWAINVRFGVGILLLGVFCVDFQWQLNHSFSCTVFSSKSM